MCFGGWIQPCPRLSVCFPLCCININPAVFSSFWRKARVFFFFIRNGKWDTVGFFVRYQRPLFSLFFNFFREPLASSSAEKCVPSFCLVKCFQGDSCLPPHLPPCPPFQQVDFFFFAINFYCPLFVPSWKSESPPVGKSVTWEHGVPTFTFHKDEGGLRAE